MEQQVTHPLDKIRYSLNISPINEKNGRWYFREVDKSAETHDSFDQIKLFFKKSPRLYYFLISVISPVKGNMAPLRKFLGAVKGIVLNIGSGNEPKRMGVINIDMMDYDNVDFVADIHSLPFKDNSVDAIMNLAVLEHVCEPRQVMQEIHRVLKAGGLVYTAIPFMQPFHASPHDYQRYTLPGIKYLHRDFEIVESGVMAGPVSGFLWVFQELLASVLSFGNKSLRNMLIIIIMLLTFPFKYLDIIITHLQTSENTASAYYVIAMKRV